MKKNVVLCVLVFVFMMMSVSAYAMSNVKAEIPVNTNDKAVVEESVEVTDEILEVFDNEVNEVVVNDVVEDMMEISAADIYFMGN